MGISRVYDLQVGRGSFLQGRIMSLSYSTPRRDFGGKGSENVLPGDA